MSIIKIEGGSDEARGVSYLEQVDSLLLFLCQKVLKISLMALFSGGIVSCYLLFQKVPATVFSVALLCLYKDLQTIPPFLRKVDRLFSSIIREFFTKILYEKCSDCGLPVRQYLIFFPRESLLCL